MPPYTLVPPRSWQVPGERQAQGTSTPSKWYIEREWPTCVAPPKESVPGDGTYKNQEVVLRRSRPQSQSWAEVGLENELQEKKDEKEEEEGEEERAPHPPGPTSGGFGERGIN